MIIVVCFEYLPLQENEEDKKIYNTHLLINSTGDLVETYSKAHLFDVEIPGKFRLNVLQIYHCTKG